MRICLFHNRRIVLRGDTQDGVLPTLEDAVRWVGEELDWFVADLPGRGAVRAAALAPDWEPPESATTRRLRSIPSLFSEDEATVILKAGHLAEWRRTHRFCGVCGSTARFTESQRAATCTACGHVSFPRISPAVIVQATMEDRILLGRAPRHPTGGYSVLAGFVDPGESLEDAVRREVMEESGITLEEVSYFGSQPWPFPDSLMVGFRATTSTGRPVPHDHELEDVRWFKADELPSVPPPYSIARTLIDDFAERHGRDPKSLDSWSV